jgi:16S rRNA (uracil1498-N3)-methyltransferase
VSRNHVEFAIVDELPAHSLKLDTVLLLSIVKFDAFEWALEKATELGVGTIVPLAAARSEKALLTAAAKRSERWKKILLEASQQSRRLRVPALSQVANPEAAFSARRESQKILLSERPEAPPLRSSLNLLQKKNGSKDPPLQEGNRTAAPAATVALAIGPEGGWTDSEVQAARAAQFREASLGQLILRTETAVIAALASLNFALGAD